MGAVQKRALFCLSDLSEGDARPNREPLCCRCGSGIVKITDARLAVNRRSLICLRRHCQLFLRLVEEQSKGRSARMTCEARRLFNAGYSCRSSGSSLSVK